MRDKGTIKSRDNKLYVTDTEIRKHGERTGLETLVVHALNDEC